MKLRPYQEDAINIIKDTKQKVSLVMSSVGSGKTVIFSKVAAETKGRVLIVVPSTELRDQAAEKLLLIDPEAEIGFVQGSINQVEAKIVIATRQSLTHVKSKRLDAILSHGNFEIVFIDECHTAPEQSKKIINKINNDNIKVVGMSATPYNSKVIELFGSPIFKKPIMEMIEEGFLVEPLAYMVQSATNISHVKTNNGDFAQGELERAVNNAERNKLIVEAYKKYATDRKSTLVFAAGCDHGIELTRTFNTYGIKAEYIDGETPKIEREDIIKRFKNQQIPVLVNVLALTTGFDAPCTDCLIISRPTKSKALFEQILGRGLRLHPDKENALVIDVNDVVRSHDLMNIGTVFDMSIRSGETVKKAFERSVKEKEEEEVRKQREAELKAERERLLREKMEIHAQEVKLLNKDMSQTFNKAKLDFWKVDQITWALSYAMNCHQVIENVNGEFIIYNVFTEKDRKEARYVNKFENVKDAISYIESKNVKNTYTDRKADWKTDAPTQSQLKYCAWCTTKWEVSCYFGASSIRTALKKGKMGIGVG